MREICRSISSATLVWLPSFTAAISRCSAVLSPFSIQHDTQQFATNQQRKPTISKWWATVARIWPPPRRLWCVSNVSPAAVFRTRAIISRCTESASRTAGKQSSHLANIFQLYSSSWTSFWRTRETSHYPPNETIPAACRTTEMRCCNECGPAPIAGDFLQQIWRRWWAWRFVRLGWCRGWTPSQLKQT